MNMNSNEDLANVDLNWTPLSDAADLDLPVFDALPIDMAAGEEIGEVEIVDPETSAAGDVAEDLQAQADDAVVAGDYEAAAELRETAEVAADVAGDADMLHGPDARELEQAAEHLEMAEQAEQRQAEHAREGDYEAARDDATEAVDHFQTADALAAGDDHSQQAQSEAGHMDWADWNQDAAVEFATDAVDYADQGSTASADAALGNAADYQDLADWHSDMGEHGGALQDTDMTPEVTDFDVTPSTDAGWSEFS